MLKAILKTTTFRQSQITIIGTLINGILGALFLVVLARFLGPTNFGIFTIATTSMVLVADIADVGTNTGLVRFVSKNLSSNVERAYKFLKLGLVIKIIAWMVSFVIVFLFSPFLAEEIFNKAELTFPMRLAGFGVGGALLFSFVTSSMQAYQKYFTWSLLNIFSNGLRLLLILVLSYITILDATSGLFIYIIIPFFGFFIGIFILPTRKILQSQKEFSLGRDFFRYNISIAAFTVIASLSAKLDTYLTAALLSSKEVGIYGLSNQLVQFMPQLVSALGLVSSPKFASFYKNSQMLLYFKKLQLLISGLCLLGILAIPVAVYLIPVILGTQYQDSVAPFVILFIAQLVFLFSIPVHHSVIFYFGRSDVFIWVSLGHLLIIGGLGYILISNLGMIGAAIAVLIGTIFNFFYPLIWLILRLKKNK